MGKMNATVENNHEEE